MSLHVQLNSTMFVKVFKTNLLVVKVNVTFKLTSWGLSMRYCSGERAAISGHWSVFDPAALIHRFVVLELRHWFLFEHLLSTIHQPQRGLPLPRQLAQLVRDEQLARGSRTTWNSHNSKLLTTKSEVAATTTLTHRDVGDSNDEVRSTQPL